MESEGFWGHLLEAVTPEAYLAILDRYEAALKGRYPNEMREAYIRILTKEAAAAFNRKRYRELALYLKKLRDTPVEQNGLRSWRGNGAFNMAAVGP